MLQQAFRLATARTAAAAIQPCAGGLQEPSASRLLPRFAGFLHSKVQQPQAGLQTDLFNTQPTSLTFDRPQEVPRPGVEENFLLRSILRLAGFYSQESQLIRGAKLLYETAVEQATNPKVLEALGLEGSKFAPKYYLLSAHVWLILVRLRAEGAKGKQLAELVYDRFQEDVEIRVRREGVKVRLNQRLKDLEQTFYGSCIAYDESMEGKQDLPEAVLRNVYGNDSSKTQHAKLLARYLRRELACLSMTPTDDFVQGRIMFSAQASLTGVTAVSAGGLSHPPDASAPDSRATGAAGAVEVAPGVQAIKADQSPLL